MIRINDILDQIHSYMPDADTSLVEKAYVYSAKVHAGQTRLSGEPYLSHPLAVAFILAQQRLDLASITAGLLHDSVEDTLATIDELEKMFGRDVARIVDGVTKISQIEFQSKIQKQAENIRKMILAMSKDIRVLLVKLADRLHNMRTLQYQKPHKRVKIARETLDIYAPLASRLGIDWMKRELEDLAFSFLYPEEYHELRQEVETRLGQRKAYVEEVKEIISKKMAEYSLSCRVLGRPKHIYSIYRKMRRQNVTIDEIYDLIAFRIILKSVTECYEALGIVHALWKPVPGRFKDYIARPKGNGYRSLHTSVLTEGGRPLEIQIRSRSMHETAEYGIAAHWAYKEGKDKDQIHPDQIAVVKQLKTLRDEGKDDDAGTFLDAIKRDVLRDSIIVYTPKGDPMELPEGSTAIDLAYHIHTEVGEHCMGAKADGTIIPLTRPLENTQTIHISQRE